MTTAEARDDVLGLIGIGDAAHADTAVLTRILSDQNRTLQVIWTMLPQFWSEDNDGELLPAPVSFSGLTLTHGGKSFTGGSFTTAQIGRTVRITGDENDNELATTTSLVRPYLGPSTAAGSGTIYGDCITLGTSIIGVLAPVILQGEHELVPLRGHRDLRIFSATSGHYAKDEGFTRQHYTVADPREINTPVGYLVRPVLIANVTQLRLRVAPLPDRDYVVTFEKRTSCPRVTALNSTVIPMPQDLAESVFLPIFRHKFSTWKHFPESSRKTVKEESDEAFSLLVKMKPQPMRLGRAQVDPENW